MRIKLEAQLTAAAQRLGEKHRLMAEVGGVLVRPAVPCRAVVSTMAELSGVLVQPGATSHCGPR
jgi:hypothetical protein